MNGWFQLLEYASKNVLELIILSIVVIPSYLYITKRQYSSIFDPFFLSAFSSACAFTTGVYAYIKGIFLYEELFTYFVLSEVMYLIGVCIFKPKKNDKDSNRSFFDDSYLYDAYYIFFIVYIMLSLGNILLVGLPVFVVGDISRLEMYSGGSGGVQVLLNALVPAVMLLALYINYLNRDFKTKWMLRIVFIFTVINLFGNGSKSAMLPLIYIIYFWYVFLTYNLGVENIKCVLIKRMLYCTAGGAVIVSMVVLSLESLTTDPDVLFQGVITRLVGYGDIFPYYYGFNYYPNNIAIDDNPLVTLFGPFLQSIRIYSYDGDIADSIGLQIFQHLYNTASHYGPNPRHNVFGLVLFGPYGSVIYSLIIGILSSYIRNRIDFMNKKNIIYIIYYYYMYNYACIICMDNSYGLTVFLQSIIVTTSIFVLTYIVCYMRKSR